VIYVAAGIVIATLVAMASGKVDPVLALLVALIVAGLLGIVPAEELFAGLGNPAVITVAAMLVIAKGIVQTGVVSRATWSLLIPATKELEQTRDIPARQVLLPIAHVTTLAGAVTLIGTSSNLVIAGIAGQSGIQMSMLSFAPVALPVALVGWATVYLTAPHMLQGQLSAKAPTKEWRVEIPITSPALAERQRASRMGIAKTQQYELTGIQRWGEMVGLDTPIEAGDVLVFAATETGVSALWGSPRFGMPPHRLFAATVKAGESGTLRNFEDDGSIRVIAARTTKPSTTRSSFPRHLLCRRGECRCGGPQRPGSALAGRRQPRPPSRPRPGLRWLCSSL
jgi:hypothetical protein